MRFQSVWEAYFFFRGLGYSRLRALRYARSVIRNGAVVELLTIRDN